MSTEPSKMPEEIDIARVILAFKRSSSYDFSDYSEKSFARRVDKILTDHALTVDQLVKKIESDPVFVEQTVKEITVNTTELFRDIDIWHAIKYRILPKLRKQEKIRIWHAGCSTGQEVYSMAIILWEMGIYDQCEILATDINTDVMERAKKRGISVSF
jgi:chemotaxis protein methyltransferase CheR